MPFQLVYRILYCWMYVARVRLRNAIFQELYVCLTLRSVRKTLAAYPEDTLFIVYCAGPHCNGADRAGLALAKLGRPVKKMLGGVTGWADEGFEFTQA